MNGMTRRLIMFALTATLALAPATTLASKALPEGAERTLTGHSFMPSHYIEDPFVASTVGNNVGGGMATNLARPFVDLDGNLLFNYEGQIFFAALGLDYQQNLWETWSVRLLVDLLARTGSNLESLVSEGATVDRNLEIMIKKRLWRGDKTQVTASLDWGYSVTTLFSLRAFAEHIWGGGSVEDAPLTLDNKIWQTRLGVSAAHALTPALGLRANLRGGAYEEPEFSSVVKAMYELGAMVDWDLKSQLKVPIGVSLGYLWGAPEDNPHTGLSGATLGFWFTGTKNFTIGVETGWWKKPVLGSTVESEGLIALFSLRHWF